MISSNLETNRVEELDQLLTEVKPRILDFIARANLNDGLGHYTAPTELTKIFLAAQNDDLLVDAATKDRLFNVIDTVLQYSVNTWHPGFMDKLYALNNPIGVISDLLLSILNTNSHVYTVSPVLSVIENYIGKKYARKFFNNDTCGGLTFPGGSWSNITSLQMARSLRYPETKEHGNAGKRFAVYTSKHCHYSVEKAAILCGLGLLLVFKVAVDSEGKMNTEELEAVIQLLIEQGYTPLYINGTAGTTVFGSYDDFETLSTIAKKYNCHFHIDGSWGGNVIFLAKYRGRLAGCHLADSITVNPHKMLGTPTTCSFLLIPDVLYFQRLMSLKAPYLFHSNDDSEENFDLADGTMGCGRRADSFKFYLGWLYYGSGGFEKRVDHAFEIVNYFTKEISKRPGFELVVEDPQCLQVCFYYQKERSGITRIVLRELHKRGRFLVDYLPHPDKHDSEEFFRVVFNSPILTDEVVDDLIRGIEDVARE